VVLATEENIFITCVCVCVIQKVKGAGVLVREEIRYNEIRLSFVLFHEKRSAFFSR